MILKRRKWLYPIYRLRRIRGYKREFSKFLEKFTKAEEITLVFCPGIFQNYETQKELSDHYWKLKSVLREALQRENIVIRARRDYRDFREELRINKVVIAVYNVQTLREDPALLLLSPSIILDEEYPLSADKLNLTCNFSHNLQPFFGY